MAEVEQIISLTEIDPDYPDVQTVVLQYEKDGVLVRTRRVPSELEKLPNRQDEDPLEGVE